MVAYETTGQQQAGLAGTHQSLQAAPAILNHNKGATACTRLHASYVPSSKRARRFYKWAGRSRSVCSQPASRQDTKRQMLRLNAVHGIQQASAP
jgi:hypothetical protein